MEACQEFGISKEQIVNKIMEKFKVSKEIADTYIVKFGLAKE